MPPASCSRASSSCKSAAVRVDCAAACAAPAGLHGRARTPGPGAKALEVHRTGDQGQVRFGGFTDGVFKVRVDNGAPPFDELMRLRSLRRACSSMGKVTSCHHSSPATASISSRCSRTLGTLASSSRLLASCCTLACRQASASSLRSKAS